MVWWATSTAVGQDAPKPDVKPALPEETIENREPPALPKPTPALTPAKSAEPKPVQDKSQQPGAGAQVQTGSQIGQGTMRNLANRLAALLGDHQFLEMEQLLSEADSASGSQAEEKPAAEKLQMYRGVLANRENKPEESIRELEPLLEQKKLDGTPALTPEEEKLVRKTLAEDYLRAGDWAKAAQAYSSFESRSALTPTEKDEVELPLKLLPLAADHPPMTVEPGDAFALPFDRDALGLTDVPVFVDAQSHDWMLDPTAPFNLICRSTAKLVGLKVSEESATVHTITGRPMVVHATVIPRFTLGTVTYRNMTAFVFEDADYYFPRTGYQVRGVLGYAAVSALGSITVTADAQVEVQPGAKGERLTTGARFFLDGERVIAELGKTNRPEDERAFVIDVAGQQTYLSSRYFAENSNDFADKKMRLISLPGFEDKPPVPAYVAESVTLQAGGMPMILNSIEVLTEPLGNAAVDDTYGTLGVDALDDLKSYTFDYRTMRFAVKSE